MVANDGGAAFPVNTGASTEPGAYCPDPGMSLRDWFAGQALNGLLSSHAGIRYEGEAIQAYRFADAMLAIRAKDADA